jgi:xanthine/uracil permease
MQHLFKKINKKISNLVFALASSGVVLLILAVFVFVSDFVTRLVMAIVVVIIGYLYLYAAFKLWCLKKEIDKFF